MCGIAGWWQPDEARPEDRVRAMLAALARRGPDDEGLWSAPGEPALGHRRLSVLDLSPGGHQPRVSASGRFVITYNGEVYNHEALRLKLAQLGRRMTSSSDTEVLLEAVEAWGLEPALHRTAGMFAFALWDRDEQALHLVRDRLGKKPLAFARLGGGVAFASDTAALRAAGVASEIDPEAVALLARWGFIPQPRTIWRGVEKVPPASLVTLRGGGLQEPARPYWRLADLVDRRRAVPAQDLDASADALAVVLGEAVRERMVADVPVGAFLSGGIDSSAVVAIMQRASDRPVRTFTIGFTEEAYSEAEPARAVAEHLGTDHREHYVTPEETLRVIQDLPRVYDEPLGDSSQIPTLLVARMARRSVTVALSGDGGDEVFGGYNRHVRAFDAWSRARRLPGPVRRTASWGLRAVPSRGWDAAARAVAPLLRRPVALAGQKAHKLADVITAPDAGALYTRLVSAWPPAEAPTQPPAADPVAATWDALAGMDPRERMIAMDTLTYLPEDILVKVDRATMSVALEARAPLLDHRVVEFAWSLPPDHRVAKGEGKRVLRRLLSRHVPDRLVRRPKMGFGIPVDRWLRGPLHDWASGLLDPSRLREQGLLDAAKVQQVWQEHLAGLRDHQARLWPLLMLQTWWDHHQPEVAP